MLLFLLSSYKFKIKTSLVPFSGPVFLINWISSLLLIIYKYLKMYLVARFLGLQGTIRVDMRTFDLMVMLCWTN